MRTIRPALWCAALLSLSGSAPAALQELPCAAEAARGHLGVTIACDCTVSARPSAARPWRFRSAIVVAEVERGGAADGVLREGDVIEAVDGIAVTTPEGGRRLGEIRPGERVRLTVRRAGRTLELAVTADAICPGDPRAIGTYAPRAVGRPDGPPGAADQPTPAPRAREAGASRAAVPVPVTPDLQPDGWMGFGLACRQCGWAREGRDAAPYWESSEPPSVYAVEPESPAARAGLRPGDVITHVGGVAVTTAAGGRALGAVRPGERVRLHITRQGRPREMELVAGSRPAGPAPAAARYAGRVGDVRVEVAGTAPVDASIDPRTGELTLRVDGTTIRLRPHPR